MDLFLNNSASNRYRTVAISSAEQPQYLASRVCAFKQANNTTIWKTQILMNHFDGTVATNPPSVASFISKASEFISLTVGGEDARAYFTVGVSVDFRSDKEIILDLVEAFAPVVSQRTAFIIPFEVSDLNPGAGTHTFGIPYVLRNHGEGFLAFDMYVDLAGAGRYILYVGNCRWVNGLNDSIIPITFDDIDMYHIFRNTFSGDYSVGWSEISPSLVQQTAALILEDDGFQGEVNSTLESSVSDALEELSKRYTSC